jgi:hypothetical protein
MRNGIKCKINERLEGIKVKKCMLLLLFCFTLLLSACSQSEEDTQRYSGIISDGTAMGYEYTITREQNTFSWKVGYKGDITSIVESIDNEADLESFMIAVSDSKVLLVKLLISLTYFLIVAGTTLIFYKKNRKILKESGAIIAVLAGIAIYIALEASIDLSRTLQDAKFYYLILTH